MLSFCAHHVLHCDKVPRPTKLSAFLFVRASSPPFRLGESVSRVPLYSKGISPWILRAPGRFPRNPLGSNCTSMYHTRINSGIAHNHYTSALRVFLHDSTCAIPFNSPRSLWIASASWIVFCAYQCAIPTRFLWNSVRVTSHSKKSHLEYREQFVEKN